MKCIETRRAGIGWTRRRYVMEDGSRLTTYEVPESMLRRLPGGKTRVEEKMREWQRGKERRRKAAELRQAVLARAGIKATAVAHELGIHETYVRRIRREAEQGTES